MDSAGAFVGRVEVELVGGEGGAEVGPELDVGAGCEVGAGQGGEGEGLREECAEDG